MRPSNGDPSPEQTARESRSHQPDGPEHDDSARSRLAGRRRHPAARDYGPPRGHVIGHDICEPPPRPRDPNRPAGRIGPYGL